MKARKIPLRMCVGCQEMFEKRSLIRLVRTPEGEVLFDPTGKKAGRGVYCCRKQECLSTAIKAKRIQKAFKCEIPAQIFARLTDELNLLTEEIEPSKQITEELTNH
jgi:hypothetical protein